MPEIVGIGANVLDTLLSVAHYPTEDTKQKAEGIKQCGGGPCATGLCAAAKLGASAAFLGTVSDDSAGSFLIADFEKYGVSTEYIGRAAGCRAFTSYILLAADTVSRTCIFDRGDVPPLRLNDAQKDAIRQAKILMVDGNNLDAAIEGAKIARECGTKVLYDAGGLYKGVERLLPLADYLIPSKEFALRHTGETDVKEAAKRLKAMYSPETVVITCGKVGGIFLTDGTPREYPALPAEAIDSNGAGDVFHGAYAFAMCRGWDTETACLFSSGVSALKCTRIGAREAVPNYTETVKYLKECGIHV